MNTMIYVLLTAGFVFFGGATLAAFCWALRAGQFRNLGEGAKIIFDDGEPMGEATDVFADARAASGRGRL